jgi:hypothetical protein
MRQWSTSGNDIQYGRQVSGSRALLQRHEHLLKTDPGELVSDVEWGKRLDKLQGASNLDAPSLEAVFRGAHLADPETQDARVSIEFVGETMQYSAVLVGNDGVETTLETVIE